MPGGLTFTEAASLPEAVFTVWSNIFERGNLRSEETLLIHGGSSGIGVTVIQIANAWNCKVFVTVGTEEKGKRCMELGADGFVNYKTEDFEKALAEKNIVLFWI